jgi:hypothetical protein
MGKIFAGTQTSKRSHYSFILPRIETTPSNIMIGKLHGTVHGFDMKSTSHPSILNLLDENPKIAENTPKMGHLMMKGINQTSSRY